MIVDRYDHINLFEELVPKLITSTMEPELAQLDRLSWRTTCSSRE